jgi:hypothetical protein
MGTPPNTSEVRDKLERPQSLERRSPDVSRVHCVLPTYSLAVDTFLRRFLAVEIWPQVTNQKTFLLRENDLEKGWYVIFMQIIFFHVKKARKKPKTNEFSNANQIKKTYFWNLALKKPI